MSTFPTYIKFPIETNPDTLAQQVYDYIVARAPSWIEDDGNLDVWIIQAMTAIAAEIRDLASDFPTEAFRWFGNNLVALPPIDATPSTVLSTWTVRDNAGYTIPAGTLVGIRNLVGGIIPFEVVSSVLIPPGSTATAAGGVTLRSTDGGASTAGLGSVGGAVELIDVLDFVTTAVQTAVTSGGIDAETDDQYLNRLARHMTLLSTRPILPRDFAILARDVPGVYRVVIIDGYNPVGPLTNQERMVTFAAIDTLGADVSTPVKNAVQALLDANREVNFVVNSMNANRTQVDVTYTAKVLAGYDPTTVQTNVNNALKAFLDPAVWGRGASNDPQEWTEETKVHYSDVAAIISNTEGVDYWSALTIGIHGSGLSAADVTLTSPASLAQWNTITATVT